MLAIDYTSKFVNTRPDNDTVATGGHGGERHKDADQSPSPPPPPEGGAQGVKICFFGRMGLREKYNHLILGGNSHLRGVVQSFGKIRYLVPIQDSLNPLPPLSILYGFSQCM